MNKIWQKNSWVIAAFFAVQGTTGILQAYIFSKHQPEAALFVPELVIWSLVLVLALLSFAVNAVSAKKSEQREDHARDVSPGHSSSSRPPSQVPGQDIRLVKWIWEDGILLVMAILVFLAGIAKVGGILDDLFFYKIPVTMTSSMIIAGLWLGCSVLFFAVYLHRKRRPRSMEALPRLARSRGQPKEAREE
jgi:amino acid transporter